jgi:urease accessory protein
MQLTFGLQNGATVLRDAYFEVPFKVTHVMNSRSPVAQMILMHCTAGLFGGDELECSIRVERGARIRITQQSATKIHPSKGCPAVQRIDAFVEAGAELQLYFEPVIPFADSRLQQKTHINVMPGGKLAFWEGFMTGRVGRGESWRFREFASETRLTRERRLVYLDRFHLHTPTSRSSTWAMGSNNYLGTGLYVGDDAGEFASGLRQNLPETGIDSVEPDVVLVRVAAPDGPAFHRSRRLFCRPWRTTDSS